MTFSDILNKYDCGINPVLGLQNAGGSENVLFSAAEIFTEEFNSSYRKISGSTENEEQLKEYAVIMHGLKGALSNIGALRLSAYAASLEKAARDKDRDYIIRNTVSFLNKLTSFNQSLNTAVKDYKNISESGKLLIKSADKAFLHSETEKLKNSLIDFDAELAEEALNGLYGAVSDEETLKLLDLIKGCLKRFDFEAALKKTEIITGG